MANTKKVKLFNKYTLTLTQVASTNNYALQSPSQVIDDVNELWQNIVRVFDVPQTYQELIPEQVDLSKLECAIVNDKIKGIEIGLNASGLHLMVEYIAEFSSLQLTMKTNQNIQNDIIKLE